MPDELSDDILQNDAFSNLGYQRLGQEIFLSVMKIKPPNFFSLHPLKTILMKKMMSFLKKPPLLIINQDIWPIRSHIYTHKFKLLFFLYVAFSRSNPVKMSSTTARCSTCGTPPITRSIFSNRMLHTLYIHLVFFFVLCFRLRSIIFPMSILTICNQAKATQRNYIYPHTVQLHTTPGYDVILVIFFPL